MLWLCCWQNVFIVPLLCLYLSLLLSLLAAAESHLLLQHSPILPSLHSEPVSHADCFYFTLYLPLLDMKSRLPWHMNCNKWQLHFSAPQQFTTWKSSCGWISFAENPSFLSLNKTFFSIRKALQDWNLFVESDGGSTRWNVTVYITVTQMPWTEYWNGGRVQAVYRDVSKCHARQARAFSRLTPHLRPCRFSSPVLSWTIAMFSLGVGPWTGGATRQEVETWVLCRKFIVSVSVCGCSLSVVLCSSVSPSSPVTCLSSLPVYRLFPLIGAAVPSMATASSICGLCPARNFDA